jgi:starch synthase (maltosyl-transferring)
MDAAARPGSGEYLDNEKYELRQWNVDDARSLRPLIKRLNAIRREHPALQDFVNLHFHRCENDALICYSKCAGEDVILVVVNLDAHHLQSGTLDLDLDALGLESDTPFQAHDLLGGGRFLWSGARNYVELDPDQIPAHIFRIRRKLRTEFDFDYFV